MIFRISTELCNHHHSLILEHFYQSKMIPHAHLQSFSVPTPIPYTTTLGHLNTLSDDPGKLHFSGARRA